jgi:hypothetical protein
LAGGLVRRAAELGRAVLAFALEHQSIFQSKDDPEIGFRFQYKMILET